MLSRFLFLIPKRFRKEKQQADEDLFFVRTSDQKRTVNELIHESKLSQTYYFMLIFSAIIITIGLLMSNMAVLIAGMIVAPLIKPILALALGLTTRDLRLVFRSFIIVIISSILVISASSLIYYLYRPYISDFREGQFVFNGLYFVLSVFSGMAAAFAWTKPGRMQDALAGTAIAVTMLPPLGMLGIFITQFELEKSGAVLLIFLYNLVTIVGGSVLVFMLSGFATQKQVKKEIEKQLDEEEKS